MPRIIRKNKSHWVPSDRGDGWELRDVSMRDSLIQLVAIACFLTGGYWAISGSWFALLFFAGAFGIAGYLQYKHGLPPGFEYRKVK
jgi:hypothetical protein